MTGKSNGGTRDKQEQQQHQKHGRLDLLCHPLGEIRLRQSQQNYPQLSSVTPVTISSLQRVDRFFCITVVVFGARRVGLPFTPAREAARAAKTGTLCWRLPVFALPALAI